jgi:type IX secretion system substrate protein
MAQPGIYERFDISAYPNPSTSSFKLYVDTVSDQNFAINVYDMIGRLIESYHLSAGEANAREIGNEYQSGVYNIIVSQGETVKTLRVIKR